MIDLCHFGPLALTQTHLRNVCLTPSQKPDCLMNRECLRWQFVDNMHGRSNPNMVTFQTIRPQPCSWTGRVIISVYRGCSTCHIFSYHNLGPQGTRTSSIKPLQTPSTHSSRYNIVAQGSLQGKQRFFALCRHCGKLQSFPYSFQNRVFIF